MGGPLPLQTEVVRVVSAKFTKTALAAALVVLSGCEVVAGIQDLQLDSPGDDGGPGDDARAEAQGPGSDAAPNGGDGARSDGTTGSVDGEPSSDGGNDATATDGEPANDAPVDGGADQTTPDSQPPVDAGPDSTTQDSGPIVIELIDDMEQMNGQPPGWLDGLNTSNPRTGTWFVFDDGTAGGVLTPAPGGQPAGVISLIPNGGRSGSLHAAHSTANGGFTAYGAGMGFNLNAPASPPMIYNASAYRGFTFWARASGNDAATVPIRFIVLDRNRALPSSGGICDGGACSGAYGFGLSLTATWTQYVILYSQLLRPPFSTPDGVPFDPANMIGCQFQGDKFQAFDLWIDDISFVK
jgi:hypothetical protein